MELKFSFSRSNNLAAVLIILFLAPLFTSCADIESNRLNRIKKAGVIRLLTRNNAHCYYTYRGEKMGFEYELAQAFAKHLGVRLDVVTAPWEELIPRLINGEGDLIAASMTILEQREKLVDFSESYLSVQQKIIVHKDNRDIGAIDDLNGKHVHVRDGTSYVQRLNELRDEKMNVDIQLHDDIPTEELIRMVAEKEIEATVADSNIALLNRRYYPEVRIAFPLNEAEGLGWAVAKERHALLNEINEFFKKINKNGTFAKIYEKYYASVEIFDYVDITKYHQRLNSRLPKYESMIRRAAADNGFDWRLIAAMVYQESHFNPSARSYTGVRGLMQLTLATARELGIKNRLDPAQSIEGGVRYLKKQYDRYPEIAFHDRIRIALASYNVGAGHVADAMKIAARKGLNPNSWQALQECLPLLRFRKYYQNARYGYCRGTEPVRYVDRVMNYFDILKREAISS